MKPASPRFEPISPSALAHLQHEPSVRLTKPYQVLLTVNDAKMQFGERVLWEAVNFSIGTGEFVALLGANGTGKTTLLQSLLRLVPLSAGQVMRTPHTRIGYVPQLKNFDPKLPIRGRDLVRLGLDGKNLLFGWIDPHKTLGRYWMSTKQKNYHIDKAIDEVGGRAFSDAPLNMLSGGEQQRMRIAQALVSEPDLLLMDEPLLSLDVASQQVVSEILAHRKQTHHTAILMISHEIEPIIPLIDKVVLLAHQRAQVGDLSLLPMSSLYNPSMLSSRVDLQNAVDTSES